MSAWHSVFFHVLATAFRHVPVFISCHFCNNLFNWSIVDLYCFIQTMLLHRIYRNYIKIVLLSIKFINNSFIHFNFLLIFFIQVKHFFYWEAIAHPDLVLHLQEHIPSIFFAVCFLHQYRCLQLWPSCYVSMVHLIFSFSHSFHHNFNPAHKFHPCVSWAHIFLYKTVQALTPLYLDIPAKNDPWKNVGAHFFLEWNNDFIQLLSFRLYSTTNLLHLSLNSFSSIFWYKKALNLPIASFLSAIPPNFLGTFCWMCHMHNLCFTSG